jgi:two-component system chemotaxis response regulator CheB
MAGHEIIVIGASAGGVEALMKLVRGLPKDLPAAIFIVMHLSPHKPSRLPDILERTTNLQVSNTLGPTPRPFKKGEIYIAPPDMHLIVDRGHVSIARGPKENLHRPSVDVLFRSAAAAYGPAVVGVVLSGNLDDGTVGLQAIKNVGGIAIVQDPQEALHPSMPLHAVNNVAIDFILPVKKISEKLVTLAHQTVREKKMKNKEKEYKKETEVAAFH